MISVAEILELLYFFLKELEDSIGGLAILELLGEWILGQVYSSELAIVSQGRIENDFKVGRGVIVEDMERRESVVGCVVGQS